MAKPGQVVRPALERSCRRGDGPDHRAAARLFGVPMALVSIVDRDRVWFKSQHGLPGLTEIAADPACACRPASKKVRG